MDNKARILVVEDDETIALGLVTALRHAGYDVQRFDRAEMAVDAVRRWNPNLVLLDIMLPGVDGLQMLRYLRMESSDLPVILLTAKAGEGERIIGLDAGADDYVTKPFSIQELLARVRARLRTQVIFHQGESVLRFGPIVLDLRKRVVVRDGVEERLTTHEAGVLLYLVEHKGKDITREELLEHVWGYSPTMQTRTVDNQILKLRKKVELVPNDPRHILTVHGIGYRFEP